MPQATKTHAPLGARTQERERERVCYGPGLMLVNPTHKQTVLPAQRNSTTHATTHAAQIFCKETTPAFIASHTSPTLPGAPAVDTAWPSNYSLYNVATAVQAVTTNQCKQRNADSRTPGSFSTHY